MNNIPICYVKMRSDWLKLFFLHSHTGSSVAVSSFVLRWLWLMADMCNATAAIASKKVMPFMKTWVSLKVAL